MFVSPGYFELDSIIQIQKTLEQVRDNFNPGVELFGFLFAISEPTVNTKTSLQILRQTYAGKVFNAVMPRNVEIKDAHFNRKTSSRSTPMRKLRMLIPS